MANDETFWTKTVLSLFFLMEMVHAQNENVNLSIAILTRSYSDSGILYDFFSSVCFQDFTWYL